jgi:hypothetical protein
MTPPPPARGAAAQAHRPPCALTASGWEECSLASPTLRGGNARIGGNHGAAGLAPTQTSHTAPGLLARSTRLAATNVVAGYTQ